jgi:uncharacterized protein (DUF302 family)
MRSRASLTAYCLVVLIQLAGLTQPTDAQTPTSAFSKVDASWVVIPTPYRFSDLIGRLEVAIKANAMNVVNVASASEGAKAQGVFIPGNRVVGVFRNDFARRMLVASVPAGIEAPIRIYLVEAEDGRTTLSYRRPSQVFAPYYGAPGGDLEKVAVELDAIFEKIAFETAAP